MSEETMIVGSYLVDKKGNRVEVTDAAARAAAAANSESIAKNVEDINQLNEENAELKKQCYALTEMPLFLGRLQEKNNPYIPVEILDFDGYGLCVQYSTRKGLYSLDPASLTLTKLCDLVYSSETPGWYCAKILPTWGDAEKDKLILWDRTNKAVYTGVTGGTVTNKFPSQQLGWLRNQGIDTTINSQGYTDGTTIYAEYYLPDFGVDVDTVHVYRSTDNGNTWTSVFEQKCRHNTEGGEVFHFHFVRQDPYNPGHWYLGSGDQDEECNMWRSVDDGLTWTKINDPRYTGGLQPIHRTCDLFFTEDFIYWGTDDHMEELEGFKDAVWCKSPRNLETNQLEIEVLADLNDQVRLTVQTPYGVLLATEKASYAENSWIWLAPYDDLDHPVLICKHYSSFGNQVQRQSYGSRFFYATPHRDDYPRASADTYLHVMDISRVSRLD